MDQTDWIRDVDGGPKEMPNGKLVLQKKSGACFAVRPDDLEDLIELAEEALTWYDFENQGGNDERGQDEGPALEEAAQVRVP